MTGLEVGSELSPLVGVAVLLVLVVGAAVGSVLRGLVMVRVAAAHSRRGRALGTAWVNVPASAVAAAALMSQLELGLLPGQAPAAVAVLVVGVIGLCGGLSTYSALALEVSRSVLAGRRRDLMLQLAGVGAGVLAGLFGAGVVVVALLLR